MLRHRSVTILTVVSLALVAFVPVIAEDAPPPPIGRKTLPASEVVPLIEKLASRDYREREKANQALAKFGDRALPHLKAALAKSEIPEAQRRLEVLVTKLEREQFLSPSLVSLSAKNQPIKLVLKDLCRQAGYEFKSEAAINSRVTMEFDQLPFWEAVTRVCVPANLRFENSDEQRPGSNLESRGVFSAYLVGDSVNPYSCISGPFRFTAINIHSMRNVQLSNIPRSGPPNAPEVIYLNCLVQGEPKCPIVGQGGVVLSRAVDDLGGDLLVAGENATMEYPVGNFSRAQTQNFSVGLNRAKRDAKMIKELRGKVGLVLLKEMRPDISIEKLTEGKKGKFAGSQVDLELSDIKLAENSITLSLTFRQRESNPNDYNWWQNVFQRLQLVDDRGQKWTLNNMEQTAVNAGSMSAQLGFTPHDLKRAGKPAKFEILEWVTTRQEIEFHFKNVPLP